VSERDFSNELRRGTNACGKEKKRENKITVWGKTDIPGKKTRKKPGPMTE
jgi:hypothetical protein